MMKINKYITAVVLSAVLAVSCTKDFETVNTNPNNPTDKDIEKDGLASGGYFVDLVQRPIPTGSGGTELANEYQVAQNMSVDNWVGYFSPGVNKWDNSLNQTSYYVSDGRGNGTFDILVGHLMTPFFKIKTSMHNVRNENGRLVYEPKDLSSNAIYQVAQIVKIMGMHRATDMFGPIPYSDMEPGKQNAKYDSQKDVYALFLRELDDAVRVLNQYGTDKKILEEFDPVYKGDTSKWVRLANSLMLRLAIRVSYADSNLASTYITKATTNAGGLIENDEQAGKLVTSSKYLFYNSLVTLLSYKELKAGATIISYLDGYADPRMDKYFAKGKPDGKAEGYYGVRSGLDVDTDPNTYAKFSLPKVLNATPTYWLRASEVQFLLAEAALRGFYSGGSAEALYKKGIELSFVENGLSASDAQTYYNASGAQANYVDAVNSNNNVNAVSTIDKKWITSGSVEEHLEQIITQKYIANYPNGYEAWSEWRRTGYPRMFNPVRNLSNVGAQNINSTGKDLGMRRFPFPQKEIENNGTNVLQARTLLEGSDNAATNVWWDKKTK